ncbi:transglutaminase-like domain-containing protein [Streptacidiphilus sp. PAMC 29251]
MTTVQEWAQQSRYSDPGACAAMLDAWPRGADATAAVLRELLVHYRAGRVELSAERVAQIDLRWADRILAAIRASPAGERVAGCCRDFTLLTVAALRSRGVPARSRVGFVGYFHPGFHTDHAVVEYWDGSRWVLMDPILDPATDWGFDPDDLPRGEGAGFWSAARAWTAVRRGEADPEQFGVDPELPIRGAWLIHRYVLLELAHRRREELLLWDGWGTMPTGSGGGSEEELALVDGIAALLLAADDGDADAERELATRYREDREPRLGPDGTVFCFSPTGAPHWVDLDARRVLDPVSGHAGTGLVP